MPGRDNETKMISDQFAKIGQLEQELMQRRIEDNVRRAVPGIENTIQGIDVPVIPASVSPNKLKGGPLPVKRNSYGPWRIHQST